MTNYLNEKITNNNFLITLTNGFKKFDYTLFDFYPFKGIVHTDLNNLSQTINPILLEEINKNSESTYNIKRSFPSINRGNETYKLNFEIENRDFGKDSNKNPEQFSSIKVFLENVDGKGSFGITEVCYCKKNLEAGIELHYTLSEDFNKVGIKSISSDDEIELNFSKNSNKITYNHIQVEDYTTRNYAEDYQDIDYNNNPEGHADFQKNFYNFFKLSQPANKTASEHLYPILSKFFFEENNITEENIDFIKMLHDIDLSDFNNLFIIDNQKIQKLKI